MAREAVYIQYILNEMGHKQPATFFVNVCAVLLGLPRHVPPHFLLHLLLLLLLPQ